MIMRGRTQVHKYVVYLNTYSPLLSCNTIRMLLFMSIMSNWYMKFIDFVLAFLQAAVKNDIYMIPSKLPKDFEIPELPRFTHRFIYA